ncbi:YbcC family protein [Aurantibacillus circumpalustris]|uniref:YbcC family protein n=1 Tax=Aurantibacillus circumpalustris TaxID=3036359 RepID=UPI00295AD1AB|nr:DUF2309 domain-containing protein [Aurantibacillus circumpalustris]
MESNTTLFNEHDVLHKLKHYLPAQAPLKDFIHHNTLHAFQNLKFYKALREASGMFGYKVSLSLNEFRSFIESGRIREDILEKVISDKMGTEHLSEWQVKLTSKKYDMSCTPRVGMLRRNWKKHFGLDLDVLTHPILFRTICSYLDQGISIWNFPVQDKGFLNSIREMEKQTYSSFFTSKRVKNLLSSRVKIVELLRIVVGDESLYEQYLYDQQFAHQGWSGMVSVVEDSKETLLDEKRISLKDVIIFELLLEIDALDSRFGEIWSPLGLKLKEKPEDLFAEIAQTEYDMVMELWQDAYEWSYYDDVLAGLLNKKQETTNVEQKSFQAAFCIDDRETSLRDHLEKSDKDCETFATPGFFGVEFYFQPEHGKSYTKQCPAPVTPKFLIKEIGSKDKRKKDLHFAKQTHGLIRGLFMAPTLGFWSALKLLFSIFKPSLSPATSLSFSHMDKFSELTILNDISHVDENGLQIGFTIEQMVDRVEAVLKSIGLVKDFAPIFYTIGHGSSSTNNPHYAAYNCGACCGRPGSVNARVLAFMANNSEVRQILTTRGIDIPSTTQFVGGLHDTTRDEIVFYDENVLSEENRKAHENNKIAFNTALDLNAKERSRRFALIDTCKSAKDIHKTVLNRSVSLFEPRPELNHASNALCIIGSRDLTKNVFLDRRAFTNSYDYRIDPEGTILVNIMKPIGPVCGGINLEYFFSRVDNQKLGAGTKLPHNVMGLFGVANGFDGDLRPGLPSQMIEVHDPVRLLVIVEHFPEVVLKTIQSVDAMYEWFINEWVQLVSINPKTKELFVFKNGQFENYVPLKKETPTVNDITPILETNTENIPVYLIN